LLKSLLHHEAGAATRLLTSDLLALHDIHVAHQHHDERPVFDAAATNLLLGESTQADLTLFLADPSTSSRISDSDVYGGYALSLLSFAATARWVSADSTFAGWWNSERSARLFEYGMQAKRFEELCTILSGFHEAGHDFREAHFDVLKKLLGETTPFQLRARLLQLYFSLYPEKFGQHLEYTTEAVTIALEHENLTLILPSVDATVSRRLLLHYFPQRPRIVEALNVWFGSQSSKNRNPDVWVYYLLAQSAEQAPPTSDATA
ncbi:MAG: hypothetical protein IT290_02495, partial [Deltaproteobacteria bacterium]|nr:hypothetical protein [Deltaproteobacteria bacterium]